MDLKPAVCWPVLLKECCDTKQRECLLQIHNFEPVIQAEKKTMEVENKKCNIEFKFWFLCKCLEATRIFKRWSEQNGNQNHLYILCKFGSLQQNCNLHRAGEGQLLLTSNPKYSIFPQNKTNIASMGFPHCFVRIKKSFIQGNIQTNQSITR